MRKPLKSNNNKKRTVKVIRMKQIPAKNKKASVAAAAAASSTTTTSSTATSSATGAPKPERDYVSETISFVIKGKLTPIKPTVAAGNVVVAPRKSPAKKVAAPKAASKKETVVTSKQKAAVVKKLKKQIENVVKQPSSAAALPSSKPKTAKKPTSAPLTASGKVAAKKSCGETNNAGILAYGGKTDNNSSKKTAKETKPLKKVKTEVVVAQADVKKKPKKEVTKRAKSPLKSDAIDKDNKDKMQKDTTKLEDIISAGGASNNLTILEHQKAEDNKAGNNKQTVDKGTKQTNNNKASSKSCKGKATTPSVVKKTTGKKSTTTTSVQAKATNKVKTSVQAKKIKVVKSVGQSASVRNNKSKVTKQLPPVKQDKVKKQVKRKLPADHSASSSAAATNSANPDDTSTSDELTLNELCKSVKAEPLTEQKAKKIKIKREPTTEKLPTVSSSSRNNSQIKQRQQKQQQQQQKKLPQAKANLVLIKKRLLTTVKSKVKRKESQRQRKMKLFGYWNGPKRHRVASLNALAKVHCLYENETRSTLLDPVDMDKKAGLNVAVKNESSEIIPCTRTLRSVPGLRAVGKHWDMHDTTSSSEDNNSGYESPADIDIKPKARIKKEPSSKSKKSNNEKKAVEQQNKRRRNRPELIMDLKDMVVRKRMASLNASAILAASYSVEKRASKSPKSDSEIDSSDYFITDDDDDEITVEKTSTAAANVFESKIKKEDQDNNKLIEVRATPNKKVAVILNQDTDVTITGVYVNSTTRSTHHEGYCSIAGMQYRISATSHTQTAATAVATETLLQSSSSSTHENSNSESLTSCKSYTPLDALSNMQPPPGPGIQHAHPHMGPPQHVLPLPQHQLSPSRRHAGCPSAFTTPHGAPYHHPPIPGDTGYVHGYYQPAGPLITVPHGHTQQQQPPPPPLVVPPPITTKTAPLSDASPTSASPIHQPPPAPSSNGGDSSDSEVIITSVTSGKEASQQQPTTALPPPPPSLSQQPYRYSQYPGAPPGYSYGYSSPYYPSPQPPAPPSYAHHDLCYTTPYLHKYPPTFRRYLPNAQYYTQQPPDVYSATPPAQSQQIVTATPVSASGSNFQPNGPTLIEPYQPPPPTLVESYPHPTHYYPTYGPPPPPPPSCFTHSPATRSLPYINATYQPCPCPMQSCPKNVLTGPLTGDSKRSTISSIAKDSMPLPPVALALPLEPASATGPPSPARGSAGMPPPPSPAGAVYQPQLLPAAQPATPKQEQDNSSDSSCSSNNPNEKRRKARVGKAIVRNNLAAIQQNTMLLMCNPSIQRTTTIQAAHHQPNFTRAEVKREIESPKEKELEEKKEICSDDEVKASQMLQETIRNNNNNEIKHPQNLKKEVTTSEEKSDATKEVPSVAVSEEVLEPCVKTVAENVKVKNMKRKLSVSKETPTVTSEEKQEEESPTKKIKVENGKSNGSYKDLIKKDTNTVKINNGKRKLITENGANNNVNGKRTAKSKGKKTTGVTKRKLSQQHAKEDETSVMPSKRLKQTKPLAASNQQNSKHYNTKDKDKANSEPVLIENKEPQKKTTAAAKKSSATSPVNSKSNKKFAPAILDSLIAKNSIDRTIESVISESRTNSSSSAFKSTSASSVNGDVGKCANKTTKEPVNRKSTNNHKQNGHVITKTNNNNNNNKTECRKSSVANRRKSKCKEIVPQAVAKVPRRSLQLPRWSNGWTWEGEAYDSKVFLNSDETTVVRKCYPAMRHEEGDIIEVRDCVLLKAGPRKNDLPFVAKIAYLWENPDDGEMMMSLLWYYRPEHTDQGRLPADQPDEVFASRHKDSNSVACIDDKCYVLTFHEYCRYRKELRRLEEGIEPTLPCIPIPEPYPRTNRQPPSSLQVSSDMVFFCRRVYDFRQKRIVKNPS